MPIGPVSDYRGVLYTISVNHCEGIINFAKTEKRLMLFSSFFATCHDENAKSIFS